MTVSSRFGAGRRGSNVWGELVLVVALAVFAVAPLTYPGTFQAQSGPVPALKAVHLADPPVWLDSVTSQRGEGELPYFLLWPIVQLTSSGFVAIRWGYALAFLLAALAMYAWTRRWLGTEGGVLAAATYTYLPWHLGTVYVRGAYAEAWLWVLWPATLWAIDRIADRGCTSRPGFIASATVGLAALAAALGTHPALAIVSVPLLAGYGAARLTTRRRLVWAVAAVACTVTAILGGYLLAAGRQEPLQEAPTDFLYPYQLLSAAWGRSENLPQGAVDPSGWTRAHTLSYQLGLAAVGMSIVATALFVARRLRRPEGKQGASPAVPSLPAYVFLFWAAAAIVAILPTLRPSALLWRVTGLGSELPHPWQLLALAGPPLAFVAGSTIRQDERLATLPAWAGLVGLAILASYPYLAPRFIPARSDEAETAPVAVFSSQESASPQIMILAADVAAPGESGPGSQPLTLTLTWQSLEQVEQDYTVFVHLLAAGDLGTRIAQEDARPCSGQCPTNAWQAGDIVVTHYELDVPADAPPGPYSLAVGLYLLETGERASVVGRDDNIVYIDVR